MDKRRVGMPINSAVIGRSARARNFSPVRVLFKNAVAAIVNKKANVIVTKAALVTTTPARVKAAPGTKSGNGLGCWPPVMRRPRATMPTSNATVTAALVCGGAPENHFIITAPSKAAVMVPTARPAMMASGRLTPTSCDITMAKVPVAPMAAPVKFTTDTSL